MKYLIKISAIILLLFSTARAQQLPLYSQYMMNRFIINPAVAGTEDYFMVSTNNRYQWAGITDAPRTHILSVQGPHATKNIGFGGAIFSDVTGPTSRTGAYFTYAYHFNINKSSKLSLGLSGGLLQFKVDGTQITLKDAGDFVITNAVQSVLIPDFGFGAYWYTDRSYVGISVPQFIQNRIEFFNSSTQSLSRLTSHYFINAGHRFQINNDFEIEPSVLLKWAYPTIPQIDFGAKVIYQEFLWAGLAFRTQDAVSFMLGYKTKNDKLLFGYSYDQPMTSISKYTFGTHEIMVAARFTNVRSRRRYSKVEGKTDVAEQEFMQENSAPSAADVARKNKINALNQKDKALRNTVRALREQAEALGIDPSDARFEYSKEYNAAIQEIRNVYLEKESLENQ
ncbi:MAG: type IX secretion system membrane protein PorP/SprF [Bacteroidetes bacterium]|nr:type IX secretion system membrane protein PorP/SprF [Bacteroidota bacterium]